MIYGYARVSSAGQNLYGTSLESQEEALRQNGAEVIYKDTFTGTKKHRPELDKLLAVLKEGDTLVVTKLDRVARSTKNGIELLDSLANRGVVVHILNMGRLDGTPTGRLMRNILLAFAEFERDMIVERTSEGKAIARLDPDWKEGRKAVEYDEAMFNELHGLVEGKTISVTEAASRLGVSRAKWYRLEKERAAASGTGDSSECNTKLERIGA